jgi:hypothetical protein
MEVSMEASLHVLGWCTHGSLCGNSFELGRFSKGFIGQCIHGSLYGNFFELGPQWGINKGTTSHYFQSIQHQFLVHFLILTLVFICHQNKILLNHLLAYIVFLPCAFVFPILD